MCRSLAATFFFLIKWLLNAKTFLFYIKNETTWPTTFQFKRYGFFRILGTRYCVCYLGYKVDYQSYDHAVIIVWRQPLVSKQTRSLLPYSAGTCPLKMSSSSVYNGVAATVQSAAQTMRASRRTRNVADASRELEGGQRSNPLHNWMVILGKVGLGAMGGSIEIRMTSRT